jgi:anti-anti-sigma factor
VTGAATAHNTPRGEAAGLGIAEDRAVDGSTSLAASPSPVPFAVLDIGTVTEFRAWAEAVMSTRTETLVLDLSGVELVTAVGVSALLAVERELPPGSQLRIVNELPIVRRVLAICDLDERWLMTS